MANNQDWLTRKSYFDPASGKWGNTPTNTGIAGNLFPTTRTETWDSTSNSWTPVPTTPTPAWAPTPPPGYAASGAATSFTPINYGHGYGVQLEAQRQRKAWQAALDPGGAGTMPVPGAPGAADQTSPGSLAGAPPFGYSGAYGGIPQVPDPTTTAGSAISGNLGNLGGILGLGGQLNDWSNAQARAGYEANLPGYGGLLGTASGNAQSLLSGQIPPDVLNLIQQQGAERGAAIGSANSPNATAGMLRALGLTSLGLQQQGLGNFSTLMGLTPVGKQFDPTSMFITPEQVQAAQMAANLYKSAPIPAQKAQADLNAALAGIRAGQGNARGGVVAPSAPSTTPFKLNLPSYVTQPTAPGSPYPQTGLPPESTGYDPTTWDQWMNEFEQGTNVAAQPSVPDYGNVDAFMNQYAGQPSEEDIYSWLGIPSE